MKLFVLQTSVPDYRVPLFELIAEDQELVEELRVYAGENYFADSVVTRAHGRDWFRKIDNRFVAGRRLLWQSLNWSDMATADAVVMELNPRILSNWLLIGVRGIAGKTTVVWGHAWPRSGPVSYTTLLRLAMMLACSGVVVYTRTQQDQLMRWWGVSSSPARNSVFSRCADSGPMGRGNDFVFVGRFVAEKKVLPLIREFSEYVRKGGDAKLHLVGDGPERGQVVREIEARGLRNVVVLHGHLGDAARLAEIYRHAKYSISPGYVGLSAIQAFYMGVPMLVSRFEDHAPEVEACVDGYNTLFFDDRDVGALSDLLCRVSDDTKSVNWGAEEISAYVRARYSLESMADAILAQVRLGLERSIGEAKVI